MSFPVYVTNEPLPNEESAFVNLLAYPLTPVWSPDGTTVSYIYRENAFSLLADYRPNDLHSNIYQVDVRTNEVTPLTQFEQRLVYDATWSPDGSQLVFTVNDTVWLLEPGEELSQISSEGSARNPVWITISAPK